MPQRSENTKQQNVEMGVSTQCVFLLAETTLCGYNRSMITPRYIADQLGRKELAARLDVGETAVSNAVVRGFFPATWHVLLEQMCRKAGLECPPSLFRMRGFTQDVNTADENQGRAAQ